MPLGAARFGLLSGVADLGKLELIETQTYSSAVSVIDFLDIKENIYNVHLLIANNIQTAGGTATTTICQLYESGVLETGSVYQYAAQNGYASGTFNESYGTAGTFITPFISQQNTAGISNGYCYFYNLGDNTKYSFSSFHQMNTNQFDNPMTRFGSGVLPQASTVNGIRILNTESYNYSSFDISLYGIAES